MSTDLEIVNDREGFCEEICKGPDGGLGQPRSGTHSFPLFGTVRNVVSCHYPDGRGESSGTLKGKNAVGNDWAKALEIIPDLRFERLALLNGVNSLTLTYKGARGRLSAEAFHFGPDHKVSGSYAH